MTEEIFAGLNEAQHEAVEAVRGPVVILAGAGTGKTTTITRRIANQVASGAFEPGQILGATFTTKAAREMAGRVRRLGVPGVRIMTFHGEALAQFRRFSADQPDILSHKGQILYQIAQRLPMPHRFTALRDLAGEIEWAKNRRIGVRDYLERIGDHEPPIPPELMHRVYVNYEKRKRQAGLIDFEDLLEHTVTLLGEDARALGVVRSRYAAFTVDEYQDVNALQQALLDLWAGARDDVCVVGDDYQSIFGFTGATARHLLRFASRWDHTHVVTLTENHRSTPEVLEIANRLVPRLGGTRKRLVATNPSGPNPTVRAFDTGAEEVAWIVREARRLHDDEGVPWEEIAVLYRINGRSEDFEEALAAARVPYQVRDGSFLARPAARAFLAAARRGVAAAGRASGDESGALPRLRRGSLPIVPGGGPAAAPEGAEGSEVARVVGGLVTGLGWDPEGAFQGGEEATRQADLGRLVALAREFPGETVEEFAADLRKRFAVEDEGRGVQLMTYHRAKGLEFEAVFLPRLEDKELPFALAKSDADVAEERRLLYVGITRAKRHLSLSYAASRPDDRRTRPKPSPFLRELTTRNPSAETPASARERIGRDPLSSHGTYPAAPRGTPDSPLLAELKRWRKAEAAAAGLPAYVIFHDKTLEEIAERNPGTRAELRSIAGVGSVKMQRYGDALLSILSNPPQEPETVRATG